jgi:hypothetical protein
MNEQTYMNLKDVVKLKRPELDVKKINRENKHFKHLVDSYMNWNQPRGPYDYDEPRSTYEDDIIECIGYYNWDGFALAQHLSEYKYIEPDSDLVHILEDVISVKSSLEIEIEIQWVKENFLTISDDVIGKKVNVKQGYKKYENHYITTIRPDTYEVTISDDINKKGGWVIKYEDVTFL